MARTLRLAALPGALALLAPLALGAGCAAKSPPSRFYLLSTLEGAGPGPAAGPAAGFPGLLGVGPVEIPGYVDRPEITLRSSPHAIELAEFDRWAEPLRESVSRVLVENLATLLGGERVVAFPGGGARVDTQLALRITRFDVRTAGDCEIAVRWTLSAAGGRDVLASGSARYREPPAAASYAEAVAALSRALERLSRDLAAAVVAQGGARPRL